ncbi:MAG: glycosyltransferase [Acidobacteriota bacterium]|nr:glycosyltransferase [Acidobacteriota bacterium]
MNIFVFGSSIVSSYWNGAATYYRGCYKYLARLGHVITFAEPDAYGRQQHRDSESFSYVNSIVYQPGTDIDRMLGLAAGADLIVKHSGIGVDDETLERRVLELQSTSAITFWDVDAPATIARMQADPKDAFRTSMPQYDAVLTYGGGPWCRDQYLALGARAYFSMYNGLDPETHFPVVPDPNVVCDVLFLGNRLPDREARVDDLFFSAAQSSPQSKFLLGGEGWSDKSLPANVRYIGHVPTADHNKLNCSAGMVMNINRASMAASGFSPPTRVFEVAGAGACLLCDDWPGIADCFEPGKEILIVREASDVVDALTLYNNQERRRIGGAFHARALRDHTYAQRALQAEQAFRYCLAQRKQAELIR